MNDQQTNGRNGIGGVRQGGNFDNASFGGGLVGPNDRRPLTGEEARQMQAELRQRVADAENLARDLRAQNYDPATLDNLNRYINRLRDLVRDPEHFQNRELLANIQQEIAAGFKDIEFGIRQKLEGDPKDKLHLSGNEQVPPAYRKLVEEYYRSLSVKKK